MAQTNQPTCWRTSCWPCWRCWKASPVRICWPARSMDAASRFRECAHSSVVRFCAAARGTLSRGRCRWSVTAGELMAPSSGCCPVKFRCGGLHDSLPGCRQFPAQVGTAGKAGAGMHKVRWISYRRAILPGRCRSTQRIVACNVAGEKVATLIEALAVASGGTA